jgi:hypothetical protein
MTINYLFISVSEHFLMKSESMSASSFDFPNFRFAFFFILHTFVERSAALRFTKCHSRRCAFSVAQEQQQQEQQQRDGEAPSYRHRLPRRHLLSASERKDF